MSVWDISRDQTTEDGSFVCPLRFPWAHTHEWHSVAWLQCEFIGRSYYSHVTLAEAAKQLAVPDGFCHEPPRRSSRYCHGVIVRKFGLFCLCCKGTGDLDRMMETDEHPGRWHWQDMGICDRCATTAKVARRDRHLQVLLRDKLNKEARAAERDARRRQDQQAYQADQDARARAAASRRKRRVLEKAAYELVLEMGLLKLMEDSQWPES